MIYASYKYDIAHTVIVPYSPCLLHTYSRYFEVNFTVSLETLMLLCTIVIKGYIAVLSPAKCVLIFY